MDFNKFIVVTNIFLILPISDKRNVYMFQKLQRILNTYKKIVKGYLYVDMNKITVS